MQEPRRKCYISYKFEDSKYKDKIVNKYAESIFIDKSQKIKINSDNPDTIMQEIRDKYLKDSTVTIFLIGSRSGEDYRDYSDRISGYDSQIIIRREIQSSLYNRKNNTRNGLLGIVLPEMYKKIYKGNYECKHCGKSINCVDICDETVIKEFGRNYYLKSDNEYCRHYSEEGRYAILVKYDDFMSNPDYYIEKAYNKRFEPIANFVRVRNFN